MGLSAVSLLVDFVVHVLVDVLIALLWCNVLGDPDDGSGLCDGDDDLDIFLGLYGTWIR